jgi:hypothetical protein
MGDLTRFYGLMKLQNHPQHTEMSLKKELITILKFLLYLEYYASIFRFVILTHQAYSQIGSTGLLFLL